MNETPATLVYDPFRGGFSLRFDQSGGMRGDNLFDGLMGVSTNNEFQVCGLGSDWGYGGLLLNCLVRATNPSVSIVPRGTFAVKGDGAEIGPILVSQNLHHFELWFGTPPLQPPPTLHDPQTLISVWLADTPVDNGYPMPPSLGGAKARPVVVGIRLDFSRLSVCYPVTSVSLWTDDIK